MTRFAYLLSTASAIILALCAALQIASAHASVLSKTDSLTAAQEKAVDEQTRKPACVRLRTAIVTLTFKDGSVLIVPMTIQERCH